MIIDTSRNEAFKLTTCAQRAIVDTCFTDCDIYQQAEQNTDLFITLGIIEEIETIKESEKIYHSYDAVKNIVIINDETYSAHSSDLFLDENLPYFATIATNGTEKIKIFFDMICSNLRTYPDFILLNDDKCFTIKD